MDFKNWEAALLVRDAVERNIERISEASRRLPEELKTQFPQIPWQQIAAIGNILRHAYDRVDARAIWNVVENDLAPLKVATEAMIKRVEGKADRK